MHDNAPRHKAKTVMSFFKEEYVMDWPAQIPDINPIENVWKILGERFNEKNLKTTEQSHRAVEDAKVRLIPMGFTLNIK